MNEDLVYIRKKLDDIAEIVAESKIYIRTCNEERDLLFGQVRGLETNVIKLQTQALGKNKTFDVAIKILTLFVAIGVLVSTIVFWVIRLINN